MKISNGLRLALVVVWGALIVPTTYHPSLLWLAGPLGIYLAWNVLNQIHFRS